MKSQLDWQNVQMLERSYRQPEQSGNTWKTAWRNLWQTMIARLAVSQDPHVWQSLDEQGQGSWNAYDPKTGQSVQQVSATELRVWLEHRYNQVSWS